MHWKIEILENHSGEIGEAVPHADHLFESEEYHYDQGQRLEVAVHHTEDTHWHIFTDLDSGHRFKIPPEKYRKVSLRVSGIPSDRPRARAGVRGAGLVFEYW